MKQAGLDSSVSKAGVKTKKLAEISGCSEQMARRYVLGEALPNIDIIYKIAIWLKLSPGWLIFGEHSVPYAAEHDTNNCVSINVEVLQYLLTQSYKLVVITKDFNKITAFIMDTINNITRIKTDQTTIMQIIDTYIQSAIKFSSD